MVIYEINGFTYTLINIPNIPSSNVSQLYYIHGHFYGDNKAIIYSYENKIYKFTSGNLNLKLYFSYYNY